MRVPIAARLAAPVALLVAVLPAACSGGDNQGVRTAVVARGTVAEVVQAPGTVVARASATVTAPADGRVAALEVAEGQPVEVGDVLLRLDSPRAREQLLAAEDADRRAARAGQVHLPSVDLDSEQQRAEESAAAAFARARVAAGRIPDRRARAQALAAVAAAEAQHAAARAQARDAVRRFDAGLGSLAAALSSLGEAQRVQTMAAVAAARRTVEALTVTAPIGGVVSLGAGPGSASEQAGGALDAVPRELRDVAGSLLGGAGGSSAAAVVGAVEVGSSVGAGQRLLTLTDVSGLSLTAEVDETDVLLVRRGVRAAVELDALPGATYAATVRSIDVAPTPSARGGVSYVVRLALGRGRAVDGEIAPAPRPGMSAVVDLRVRTARDVVAVPVSAVVRDGTHDVVWVAERGVVERRPVRLGAQGEDTVEVVEGLSAGERVVVAGADQVRAGQRLP